MNQESIKGIERLKAAVAKDCGKSGLSYRALGCLDGGAGDCHKGYCDKFAWIMARAEDYAAALGLDIDAVIDLWEQHRNYWYMNYYQDSNQPKLSAVGVVLFEDWVEQIKRNHGPNMNDWAFVCPACHRVQTLGMFSAIGVDPNSAYVECIGRYMPGEGCNWAAYGLFKITKTKVVKGVVAHDVFEIAPPQNNET